MQFNISVTVLVLLLSLSLVGCSNTQQVTAEDYIPVVTSPRFEIGDGPLVLVDESHNNFHTVSSTQLPHSNQVIPGRLTAFHDLLVADGYRVEPMSEKFSKDSLSRGAVLMISNALAEENIESWALPNYSAFSTDEITAVVNWVRGGGALLLIADHQPWPGAAQELALSLGLVFHNGSASFGNPESDGDVFSRALGSLAEHPITQGRTPAEAVESVMTFGGQAFRALPGVELEPLLVFPSGSELSMLTDPFGPEPDREKIPRFRIDGMLQGAVMNYGRGRIGVFGEAAMFTAQISGPNRTPMGLNHPEAKDNAQFILNLLHWLTLNLPDT